jgi:hypothetical protein
LSLYCVMCALRHSCITSLCDESIESASVCVLAVCRVISFDLQSRHAFVVSANLSY